MFLLFKPSSFLWENIPLLSEINYPWITLGILGFIVSLLAGFLCRQSSIKYFIFFIAILAVIVVLPYVRREYPFNKGDDYYLTNDATTTSSHELMPLWVKKFPSQRLTEKVEIIKGNGHINNLFYNSKQVKFSINLLIDSIIRINTIYYPGWKIYANNIDVPISYSNQHGVMDISLRLGSHVVEAKFEETPLRLTSNIISLLTIFALLYLIIKRYKHEFS